MKSALKTVPAGRENRHGWDRWGATPRKQRPELRLICQTVMQTAYAISS